ncbi:MAG: hypothetical protein F6K41_25555 [Symploca sp. SIO3E6]|nr:hypothetical protein [Caldora sp. SIO3E6]
MRINKYQPHLLVLPEDDANCQIVNGFEKSPNIVNERGSLHQVIILTTGKMPVPQM